ncbi:MULTISPECIES: single-stranded DNA-binding protein [Lactococcus]|uniref:Single-stranded DNA-binding protein n=1 Tax=Lactococcus lactis subsp. cremoris TaxID=1359 RepID=A0A161TZS1_LACLC|nr:single-stranded DNA-binding protein [Lactococcus cremoris]AGV72374.1 single-strand binding protein Ssb1 [Lactococcus cremoris subsp. cremoris KW2]KZK06211.1 Single-stranded DNA-binding protein [Lactococcus cremoris]
MNKTMLIGRLTNAPEISKTTNNKSYVRVTLAVNRRFKNEKGEREADFISIILWGKSAETLVSYAKKGSLISVEGEIRTRNYTDKNEQKHYITEILGLSYDLLESRATLALRESAVKTEELLLEADELPF